MQWHSCTAQSMGRYNSQSHWGHRRSEQVISMPGKKKEADAEAASKAGKKPQSKTSEAAGTSTQKKGQLPKASKAKAVEKKAPV